MRIRSKISISAAGLAGALCLASCVGDYFDFDRMSSRVQARSTWGLTAVRGSLSVNNIVNLLGDVAGVEGDERNRLVVRVSDTVYSYDAKTLFPIQDQSFPTTFGRHEYDSAGGFVGGQVTLRRSYQQFPFDTHGAGQMLDSVLFRSSLFRLSVSSTMGHAGRLTLSFPHMRKNGQPLTFVHEFAAQQAPLEVTVPIPDVDGSGYMLDLTRANEHNTVFIDYTLTLFDNGSGTLAPDATCRVSVDMKRNQYEWLFGYVGPTENAIGPVNKSIPFFKKLEYGRFHFEKADLNFRIINSFGIPLRAGFGYVVALDRDGVDYPITGLPMMSSSPVSIGELSPCYPALPRPDTTYAVASMSNSNIGDIAPMLPTNIEWMLGYYLNPPEAGVRSNFIHRDNSKLEVVADLDFTFAGWTEGVRFRDTTLFTLGGDVPQNDALEYIKEARMRLVVGNGFPFVMRIQGYLAHQEWEGGRMRYVIDDSLFHDQAAQPIFESGYIGANGHINQQTGRRVKTVSEGLTVDRLELWKGSTHLIFDASFATTEGFPRPSVACYMDYGLGIDLTVEADVEIDTHL